MRIAQYYGGVCPSGRGTGKFVFRPVERKSGASELEKSTFLLVCARTARRLQAMDPRRSGDECRRPPDFRRQGRPALILALDRGNEEMGKPLPDLRFAHLMTLPAPFMNQAGLWPWGTCRNYYQNPKEDASPSAPEKGGKFRSF